jgi:hypothetical protein
VDLELRRQSTSTSGFAQIMALGGHSIIRLAPHHGSEMPGRERFCRLFLPSETASAKYRFSLPSFTKYHNI